MTRRWKLLPLGILPLALAGYVGESAVADWADGDANEARADAPGSQFSSAEALAAGRAAARDYVAGTLATQLHVDGRPLGFDDMQLVDLRFVPGATNLVISVSSATELGSPKDVWVGSWELGGVDNVHTGRPDGTAYVDIVMEDGTGSMLSASAGVRQPEVQAHAHDPLPSFDAIMSQAPVMPRPPIGSQPGAGNLTR